MTVPRDTEQTYEYGLDSILRAARRTTPQAEREADEVFGLALAGRALPTGYVVRAVIRCNQINTFASPPIACDWRDRIEVRRERVESVSRARLVRHLKAAHPYLGRHGIKSVIGATSYTLRDVGR